MTYSFNIASGALFGTRKVIVELQGIQHTIRHSGDIDANVLFVEFLIKYVVEINTLFIVVALLLLSLDYHHLRMSSQNSVDQSFANTVFNLNTTPTDEKLILQSLLVYYTCSS